MFTGSWRSWAGQGARRATASGSRPRSCWRTPRSATRPRSTAAASPSSPSARRGGRPTSPTRRFGRTNLGELRPGDPVNLERPVRLADRLGGHLVQGHVDAVGEIVEPVPDLPVRMPAGLGRYVVEKGSITVDGVSLTVVDVIDDGFTVAVIPHTAEVTTLGCKGPGDRVNLEVDVMAKYVGEAAGGIPPMTSERTGFAAHRGRRRRHRPGRDRGRRRRRGPGERGRPHHGGRVGHAREDRLLPPPHLRLHLRADHRRSGPTSSSCRSWWRTNTERSAPPSLVTVDSRHGTTTGISAADRAATIQALVDPATRPDDLARPGHIFPLRRPARAAC